MYFWAVIAEKKLYGASRIWLLSQTEANEVWQGIRAFNWELVAFCQAISGSESASWRSSSERELEPTLPCSLTGPNSCGTRMPRAGGGLALQRATKNY